MIIRKFKNNDANDVSNLIRKCLVEVNSKDYSKHVISFMCRHFTPERIVKNSSNRIIFVAVENKRVIGTVSLKKNVIYSLFVRPKLHGKGIGTELMKKAEKLAIRNNYNTAVAPSSITALEFYKKLGYKEFKKTLSKNYGRAIIMKKRL